VSSISLQADFTIASIQASERLVRRFSVLFLRRLANRNISLYGQLDGLERCGIVPNAGVGPADLLARHSEREYETDPFGLLLSVLGQESTDAASTPLSEHVWHLRVGSITGPGDYTAIAQRMALLSQGALPITDMSDEFDWAAGVVWLRFRLRGEAFDWPARLREHWIDPNLFSRFVALLEAQDTPLRFTYLDLGGQDALLGCATPQQFAELRRRTGLRFQWLG
jgi:hypothetical protein